MKKILLIASAFTIFLSSCKGRLDRVSIVEPSIKKQIPGCAKVTMVDQSNFDNYDYYKATDSSYNLYYFKVDHKQITQVYPVKTH